MTKSYPLVLTNLIKCSILQALAKESGAAFINVRASNVQSKWFGESQKHVAAIFSLAQKIEPVISFIGVYLSAALSCVTCNVSYVHVLEGIGQAHRQVEWTGTEQALLR